MRKEYMLTSKDTAKIIFKDERCRTVKTCNVDLDTLQCNIEPHIVQLTTGSNYTLTTTDKRKLKLLFIGNGWLWTKPNTNPTAHQLKRMKSLERALVDEVQIYTYRKPDGSSWCDGISALYYARQKVKMTKDEFLLLYPTYSEYMGVYQYTHLR